MTATINWKQRRFITICCKVKQVVLMTRLHLQATFCLECGGSYRPYDKYVIYFNYRNSQVNAA